MYISFGCRKHAGQNNSAVKTPQSSPRDAEAGVHVQHADSPRPRREIPRAIKREVSIAASIIRLIKKPRAIEGRREREREREIKLQLQILFRYREWISFEYLRKYSTICPISNRLPEKNDSHNYFLVIMRTAKGTVWSQHQFFSVPFDRSTLQVSK